METLRIPVADSVDLAVDTWEPAPGSPDPSPGPAHRAAGARPVAFVLVHGLASNARLWDGVAERLVERGHRAVTLDLRGHGRSAKPDGPYDIPTVADDVAAVIASLGLERPVVAGQSWGGNVVLELAAAHPDAVSGIVCVDGGWFEPSAVFPTWEACREALSPPRLNGLPRADIERHFRAGHPDWPETGIRGALANFEVRADGTIAPWLTFERHIAVLRGMWEHHPSRRYADVRVPVLLAPAVGGDPGRDRQRSAAVEAARAALPNARVHPFAGDHDIHAQHPVELADVMLNLVAEGFLA
jgi:pimeloyl-ACP methyl ester carboxylesterase